VDVWEVSGHLDWIERNSADEFRKLLESFGLKLFSFSIYFTPPARRTARLKLLGECGGQVAFSAWGGAVRWRMQSSA